MFRMFLYLENLVIFYALIQRAIVVIPKINAIMIIYPFHDVIVIPFLISSLNFKALDKWEEN